MAKEYQHRFFKTAKNLGLRSLFFVLLGFLLGILSNGWILFRQNNLDFGVLFFLLGLKFSHGSIYGSCWPYGLRFAAKPHCKLLFLFSCFFRQC